MSWEASAVTNIILGLGSQVGADVFVTQSLDVVLDVNHVSIASFGSDVGTWVFGQFLDNRSLFSFSRSCCSLATYQSNRVRADALEK